jgi:hypothetical protein
MDYPVEASVLTPSYNFTVADYEVYTPIDDKEILDEKEY